MLNPFMTITAITLVFTGTAWTQETAAPGEVTLRFSEQATPHPVWGFGGEWDPHFWRSQNTRRGCDEAAWKKVTGKIRDMGVGRVRMMILPDWYEPDNDNDDPAKTDRDAFTWDSEAMTSLYRHLDFSRRRALRLP